MSLVAKIDPAYYQFSFHDISNFLSFELLFNDYFNHFSSAFKQCKGMAMGGTISAQSASLTLLFHERHLPTNFLPPLFRYRDDYLTLLSSHFFNNSQINNHTQLLDHIKNKLSSCIHMKLKVENIGASIPFLEAQLTITDSFPSLSLKLPCLNHQPRMSNPPTPNRWLDNTSPNGQSAMSSVIPNAVGKCLFFRFDVQTLVTNLYHLSKVL